MDITKLSIISSVYKTHTGLVCMSDDKTHLREFKTLTDAFKSVVGGSQIESISNISNTRSSHTQSDVRPSA